MHKSIVYTLKSVGNPGCLPECVAVDTDENQQFSVNYVKVTKSNKSNYQYLMDETDLKLLDCCLKLDTEVIASKVKDQHARNWGSVLKKYFETQTNNADIKYIRKYLIDYIEAQLSVFFSLIASKPLYFAEGRFPFNWKPLIMEDEMPEHLYCFEIENNKLFYWLEISWRNKPLSLRNGVLVSGNPARIMLNNKIFEFDDHVEGLKLTPFFNKNKVAVPENKVQEYFTKVILPLVSTNRVLALGFDINTVRDLKKAVLHVKTVEPVRQQSLFDAEAALGDKTLVLELIFKYDGFMFWAGRGGKSVNLNVEKGKYTIIKVERDYELEKLYIDSLNEIGLNLDGKIKTFPYLEGIEWVNINYKAIEATGVEIAFENRKGIHYPVFIGNRSIRIELSQENDWFDIKGKVYFGEYEIPIIRILNYIKRDKHEILLPNGEYAQIPQSWFDEYKSLADLSRIENGNAVLSKHYYAIAGELELNEKVTLAVKENTRLLLGGNPLIDFELPEGFKGELRHYQREGYNWLRLLDELSLGGCLADDMGLGKTIQTLCLLQWQKKSGHGTSLLIVPTSLIYNWQVETERFTPELKIYVHTGTLRTKNAIEFTNADIVLTSYGIVRRDKQLLSSYNFNYIILDEAQAIKNPYSDIAQVCLTLKGRRFLTLTGTPIENSLSDLWSQVHFFNRNMLGSLPVFLSEVKKSTRQQLYRKLLQPFILRRTKAEVLPDLPEKQITVQWCDMTEAQHKRYKDYRNFYRDKFLNNKDENGRVNAFVLLEGLLRLRQIANHPILVDKSYNELSGKFELAFEMLQEITENDNKILVFSSFVEHLKLFRDTLDNSGIVYAYLDGSTKDRKEQVEKFQYNPDVKIFLLSLKAGGTGLNLTAASYVFLLDPWWNLAAEAQAYDRAHRIGQKNKVFVYKFITKNSIEEKILKLQESKLALSETMLSNETEILKQLNIEDVMKLIE
jgi:superfamily II DNA or RNA helicase